MTGVAEAHVLVAFVAPLLSPHHNHAVLACQALMRAGFVLAGPGSPNVGHPKEITIVGHSLGGAQAQLAAVEIAAKFLAKVRVITFDSILAFTPEGAQKVVDTFIVGPDGVDVSGEAAPTVKFPAEVGKITAQRCMFSRREQLVRRLIVRD